MVNFSFFVFNSYAYFCLKFRNRVLGGSQNYFKIIFIKKVIKIYEDMNENSSCDYQSVEDFQNLILNSSEVFSSLSLNIRSLKKNCYNFRNFIKDVSTDQFQFSVIGLQEIWRKSNINLKNYHPLVSNERTERRGGGVGFYVKILEITNV